MNEHPIFDPEATMNAPHALRREWGDDVPVDPMAETTRIEMPEIRSGGMDWYPGKGTLEVAGVEVVQSDPALPATAKQTTLPDTGNHDVDASGFTHEDKAHSMDQIFVFKTGPNG